MFYIQDIQHAHGDMVWHSDLCEYLYFSASFSSQIHELLIKIWVLGNDLVLDIQFYSNQFSITTCSWYHFTFTHTYILCVHFRETGIQNDAKTRCIKEDFFSRRKAKNTNWKRGRDTWWYNCTITCACQSWKTIHHNCKGNILKILATLHSRAILCSDFRPNKLDCLNILMVGVQTTVRNVATDSARWSFPSEYIKLCQRGVKAHWTTAFSFRPFLF